MPWATVSEMCAVCGKTWPARFGAGAPTVRITDENDSDDASLKTSGRTPRPVRREFATCTPSVVTLTTGRASRVTETIRRTDRPR